MLPPKHNRKSPVLKTVNVNIQHVNPQGQMVGLGPSKPPGGRLITSPGNMNPPLQHSGRTKELPKSRVQPLPLAPVFRAKSAGRKFYTSGFRD